MKSLFQLFLHGSMQHKVYLGFVVWWSSRQDQQSNVCIGHFCQNQPQSPGTYGWLLPGQEQEDSMSCYSMITFGCNFELSWQWVCAAGIVVIFLFWKKTLMGISK